MVQVWNVFLQGNAAVPTPSTWTVYDHMVAASFNYETFFSPVITAINVRETNPSSKATAARAVYGGQVLLALDRYLRRGCKRLAGQQHWPAGSLHQWTQQPEHHPGQRGRRLLLCGGLTSADGRRAQPADRGRLSGRCPSSPRTALLASARHRTCGGPSSRHELLYGVNELPPFFTASHPFMTTDGWKAASVTAARKINPDLPLTGELRVGHVLLQAEEGMSPLRYREVRIDRITRMLARDASSRAVHSLHIEPDNPGYHVHGFLVAVNYPNLREDHFVSAFADITPAERAYLRTHFEALAPFLRRGLGELRQRKSLSRAGNHADEPAGSFLGRPSQVSRERTVRPANLPILATSRKKCRAGSAQPPPKCAVRGLARWQDARTFHEVKDIQVFVTPIEVPAPP